MNSGKKWCKYALVIFMRNKVMAEYHRVTRLSAQQQCYQVDTPHNLRSIGGGGITHMELICYRELEHMRNGNCTRYHVHVSLQSVVDINMMQNNILSHAIA